LSGLPPEKILFVGDSVPKEVVPAKSLGIGTALMWDNAPEADHCFSSFKDILKLVGQQSGNRIKT
jgi:FMN phosphatase YigB (HAD superfamily)